MMKFGCSLELINMRTSGPNFIIKQSKLYWVEMFKLVAAAGFKGIELPYNPFSSDPMAFEIGRCGVPISAFAVNAKYGSPKEFMAFLNEVGIEEVTGVHINANDVMLEIIASGQDMSVYFNLFEKMGMEAIDFLCSLGSKVLVVSPTPEIGWLERMVNGDLNGEFAAKTTELLKKLVAAAKEKGISTAIKNEYWSLMRGKAAADLLNQVEGALFSPDLAHIQITGDDPVMVINAHKHQLANVRFSDTDFTDEVGNYKKINAEIPVQGNQKVFSDLGEGSVDLLGVAKVLKDNGYDGWIICESKKTLNIHRALLKMRWFIDHEIVNKLGGDK
ncbi:inosose dehydratase [Anaerobacterium chartisolvens]|uniref:Inosose dehydratase n=1 Tax=Anaerobacterium chartisolvens TaxID=1297424 RepID=A0A369B3C7_9FIRM|nr:sugar phosphate isomerase/epimerase [Anaerobacterium chartisolvens]RCX16039.1 inosose dehydratase [Anaerobacterium chartisolvens]